MSNSKGEKRPVEKIKKARPYKKKYERINGKAAGEKIPDGGDGITTDKYKTLIKNIPCAIYSALPGKIGPTIFISEKWKDWTGYSPDELYRDPEVWPKCIHPDDREKIINSFIKACDDMVPYDLEYRIIHKDTGHVRYVRDQGLICKDENGETMRVDGIITDVNEPKSKLEKYRADLEEMIKKRSAELTKTREVMELQAIERNKAEEALREIEREQSIVLENLSDLIVFRNTDMETVWASKSMADWHGMTQEQIVGRVCYKARFGRNEPCEDCHIIKTMKSGKRRELEKKLPDGKIWHVTVNPAFDDSGKVVGTIEVSQDITDRKKAHEELEKSKNILEKTFSSLDSAVFILDAKKPPLIIDCNPVATEIFGYEKHEIVGRTTEFLHINKETLSEFQKELFLSIKAKGYLSFFEFEMKRKDDTIFPSEHFVRSLKDDKDRLIGWVSVVRDITEQKQSEQALRETTGLLETIFEHTHMLVAYLDPQFNFVRVNRAYAEADERQPSFFPGRNHFDLYPNEENEEIFRRVVETGMPYFTYAKPFEYAEHPERGFSYWDWSLVPIKNQQGIVSGLVLTLADVTARKRAEEALQASEGKLSAMLQSIADPMSMMDGDLNIIWANEKAMNIFGDDIVGRKCYEAYHGRQKPCEPYPCLSLRALQDGNIHEHDTQIVSKDGKTKHFHCSANVALRDEQGKPTAVLEISKDITDQKLAEQALRESENSHRAVVENAAEGIVVVQGKSLKFVNPALLSMTGYSKKELLTRSFIEFVHPDHKEWAMGIHIKRLKGEKVPPVYELKILDKKGNTIWVENNGILIEWHDKPATLNFLRDVTDRRKAKQALKESEIKFRSITEESLVGVYVIQDGVFKYINPKFAEIFGYSVDELINKKGPEDLIHPDDWPASKENLRKRISGELKSIQYAFRGITKDKEVIHLEVYGSATEYQGHPAVIGTLLDITERVRAEQALQGSEERFRAIYENALVGLYRTTPDGRILMANPALVQMLGYSSFEEVAQLNLEEKGFASDYQRSVFKQRVEAEDRIVGLESRWMRRDGTTLFVRESARTVRDKDGEILYYEGTVADLTERKKAEEELRIREQKLRALINAPTESAILVDTEGKILDINTIAAQRLGKSAESLIGMGIYDYLPSDIAEYRKHQGFEVVRSGKPVRFQDDRKGRYYDTNIYPVFDDEGNVDALAIYSGDITEQRKAEEALRISSDIVRSIPSGLFTYKYEPPDKLFFLDGNPASERLANIKVSEIIGKEFNDIWPQARDSGITHNFLNVMKTGKTYEAEDQYYEDEKLQGAFRICAFPMSKELLGVAFENITQQKLAEEALRESEEKFRSLAEQSPNMIFINKKGKVVYANKKCEEVMGYKREELCSPDFDFRSLITTESLDLINDSFARHLKGEEVPPYDYTIISKDGTRIEVINASKLIQYEGEVAILGIVTDITERKKSELALRESEERLKILFESAPDAIYLIDSQGRFVDANRTALELVGFDRDDVIGNSLAEMELLSAGQLSKAIKNLNEAVTSEYSASNEYTLKRKDGSYVSVEVRTFPVKIGGSMLTLGIARDITEHKQTEQKLLEHQTKLKSLASQLSLTEERERYRLATDLHDQISQSLVISKIKLDQLRKSKSSGDIKEALDEISMCLGQVIEDTRTLTFDLSSPILYELGFEAAVAEWLTDQIQDKHEIETEFEDDRRPKPLDNDIMALLFRNVRELLINVVKHAKAHKVKVSSRRIGEHISVSVEDDGVGFDPVEVASTAVKKAEFGLFSIQERLEQLGGQIEIESGAGRGTKITMTAPLKCEDLADRT